MARSSTLAFLLLATPVWAGKCIHGTFNRDTKACECYKHWSTAGITDTIDFLEGVCEQYHCQSDKICQDVLGIPEATCPVKGWNCYCGWRWSWENGWHGYETPEKKGGGECMGIMYTFSLWATESLEMVCLEVWKYFLALAFLALPFGRKRAICDHHAPSMWNGIRACFGTRSSCPGTCVMNPEYTLDTFKDDMAWTLYSLDLGVWLYVFLATLWLVSMFIWSIVLWLMVIVVILGVILFGLCASCGEGLAGCECGSCHQPEGNCGDCSCCCPETGMDIFPQPANSTDVFYWSGSFPQYWDVGGTGGHCCDCDCCCSSQQQRAYCCGPIAWLIYVFPVMPENAWGGLLGYFCFGTHHHTPPDRLYAGGNPVIEFLRMGWRRPRDLHSNDSWRAQVRDFVLGGAAPTTQVMGEPFMRRTSSLLTDTEAEEHGLLGNNEVVTIGRGRGHAILINRAFDEGDNCVESSFEDYRNNKCWICMESKDTWDMWLSCHHLFCKDCSTEMLQRRMPCPLCRVSSSAVLRGLAWGSEYPAL